jgi:AraC-like DNA-binding protein
MCRLCATTHCSKIKMSEAFLFSPAHAARRCAEAFALERSAPAQLAIVQQPREDARSRCIRTGDIAAAMTSFPPLDYMTEILSPRPVFGALLHFQVRCIRPEPVATFCTACGVSPARLRHVLLREGVARARDIRALGILLRATYLLDTTTRSVEWVSNALEFSAPANFTRFFHRMVGAAPSRVDRGAMTETVLERIRGAVAQPH